MTKTEIKDKAESMGEDLVEELELLPISRQETLTVIDILLSKLRSYKVELTDDEDDDEEDVEEDDDDDIDDDN